jgi:hypothetical protein
MTDEELKALVARNSRAIGRLEKLQAQDREEFLLYRKQWQEEQRASRKRRQASREEWQEQLAASREQWQEELTASRREYDRMVASLERSMEYANRQLGKLGNQLGALNEAAFYTSLERVLRQDFHMEIIAPNVIAQRNGEELELDVLAYANEEVNTAFDVEIKTELDQEAIDQILDHLRRFPRFFREHRGKKLYGVLAAVKIPPALRRQALRQGLYLATIRDDVFDILRPEGFEARAFPT